MKNAVVDIIRGALEESRRREELKVSAEPPIIVSVPREEGHGDLATTVAMALASSEKKKPREIAEILVRNIRDEAAIIEKTEIAGPGFINFFLRSRYWTSVLRDAAEAGPEYGRSDAGRGEKVQVEFVSANPTGPLHVGHGRGAAVGDALANLLSFAGYDVQREFYINDRGRQVRLLGESVWARACELEGTPYPFPEEGYKGAYVRDIARSFVEEGMAGAAGRLGAKDWAGLASRPLGDVLPFVVSFAKDSILAEIRRDLDDFGVSFDDWFSEESLYRDGKVDQVLAGLRVQGIMYDKDGAQWFATSRFGDDKDRVVVKQDGEMTYFASDIAYHEDKFLRGFDRVIDIWGADHHGYIPRMKAVVQALGHDPAKCEVLLVQLVNLLREGQPVAMGKREGEFVTLSEVVREVGKDAARYVFLTRRSDSHLDFDLELVKKQSAENPVYYVQYAYARLCSLFRQAAERGIALPPIADVDLSPLTLPEEVALAKQIAAFPEMIEKAALAREPHRLTTYLQEIAGTLHAYYYKHRIIGDDLALTHARLHLMNGLKVVIGRALGILGVAAPERM
ncbi:MAG: arginine--tRNA ligase [Nitrospirae bacterium RBG_16_64_22]|nr:MAG: arginine--tRNA ligase [Nitrospirae bacterium RBG_16_64_22]